jgi:adenosine deaminase
MSPVHPPGGAVQGLGHRQMIDFGLRVCINSDGPPMFRTDLGLEYEKAALERKLTPGEIVATIQTGIDAAWVDESTKRSWSVAWMAEMEANLGASAACS